MIEPKPVERNKYGEWTHPDFPVWEEGESASTVKDWFSKNCLEYTILSMDSDIDSDLYEKMVFDDEDWTGWEPTKPEGEGWFVLSIHDSEDGPVCVWGRRIAAIAKAKEGAA